MKLFHVGRCSQDLPFLCEAFVNLMIILVKRDSEDTSLTLPTVLKVERE